MKYACTAAHSVRCRGQASTMGMSMQRQCDSVHWRLFKFGSARSKFEQSSIKCLRLNAHVSQSGHPGSYRGVLCADTVISWSVSLHLHRAQQSSVRRLSGPALRCCSRYHSCCHCVAAAAVPVVRLLHRRRGCACSHFSLQWTMDVRCQPELCVCMHMLHSCRLVSSHQRYKLLQRGEQLLPDSNAVCLDMLSNQGCHGESFQD